MRKIYCLGCSKRTDHIHLTKGDGSDLWQCKECTSRSWIKHTTVIENMMVATVLGMLMAIALGITLSGCADVKGAVYFSTCGGTQEPPCAKINRCLGITMEEGCVEHMADCGLCDNFLATSVGDYMYLCSLQLKDISCEQMRVRYALGRRDVCNGQ